MLTAVDPLPSIPARVLVAGVTGAGKSTVAEAIAEILSVPYTELDALYHGPAWTVRETFLSDVAALAARPAWVTEWQYRSVRGTLAERADTVVWLDHPVRVWMWRLVRRTLHRRRNRVPLWNGNTEPPLWHFFAGRDHVISWALKTRRAYRSSVPALERHNPHITVVRLSGQHEVDGWLAQLAEASLRPGDSSGNPSTPRS